jgi:hypothetical protein
MLGPRDGCRLDHCGAGSNGGRRFVDPVKERDGTVHGSDVGGCLYTKWRLSARQRMERVLEPEARARGRLAKLSSLGCDELLDVVVAPVGCAVPVMQQTPTLCVGARSSLARLTEPYRNRAQSANAVNPQYAPSQLRRVPRTN